MHPDTIRPERGPDCAGRRTTFSLVSDLFDISISTAMNWGRRAGRDWNAYLAATHRERLGDRATGAGGAGSPDRASRRSGAERQLSYASVSYTHLRAHETDSYLVC